MTECCGNERQVGGKAGVAECGCEEGEGQRVLHQENLQTLSHMGPNLAFVFFCKREAPMQVENATRTPAGLAGSSASGRHGALDLLRLTGSWGSGQGDGGASLGSGALARLVRPLTAAPWPSASTAVPFPRPLPPLPPRLALRPLLDAGSPGVSGVDPRVRLDLFPREGGSTSSSRGVRGRESVSLGRICRGGGRLETKDTRCREWDGVTRRDRRATVRDERGAQERDGERLSCLGKEQGRNSRQSGGRGKERESCIIRTNNGKLRPQ